MNGEAFYLERQNKQQRKFFSRKFYKFRQIVIATGGHASPFPHTTTVESDFSIVENETDNSRVRLVNFSLEGIMQCKEHIRMKAIVTSKKIHQYNRYIYGNF